MTRGAFLLKLLAAVGMGQVAQAVKPGEQGQCLRWSRDKRTFEWARCDEGCDDGQERCPLGHCQKPRRTERLAELGHLFDRNAWMEPRVCAICGIVYVPIATPKEK